MKKTLAGVDEVGRGTSSSDGEALAYSIADTANKP